MRCTQSIVLRLARRLHREDVVVLVLEVAGLVRAQAGEGVRHRRRLEADGRDVDEIHCVGHEINIMALRACGADGTSLPQSCLSGGLLHRFPLGLVSFGVNHERRLATAENGPTGHLFQTFRRTCSSFLGRAHSSLVPPPKTTSWGQVLGTGSGRLGMLGDLTTRLKRTAKGHRSRQNKAGSATPPTRRRW